MKRDFLKELELTEEQINAIMAEAGKDIEKHKRDAEKTKEQLSVIQEQLNKANEEINSYREMDIESIKKSANEWKTKYEAETKALNEKLEKQAYEHAAKDYLSQYKFSSELVKKAVLAEFNSKEFKLDNGVFLGADDYMKGLQESDPGAFLVENQTPNSTGGVGQFPRKDLNSVKNPFAKETFNATEQGKIFRENPDLAKQLAKEAGLNLF